MSTQLSADQAMDVLASARPTAGDIEQAWYLSRRERVLQQVLAGPDGEPAPRRRAGGRRALIAVAAGLVVVLGLFAQVLLPLGSAGSPQAAQALDRLAAAVPVSPLISAGAFELTVCTEAGKAETETGTVAYQTRRSTWTAADGWSWAHQTGDDGAWYIFGPVPRNYNLNAVPADPALMETYLRAHVSGSTSVEEAIFEAVTATLSFTPTPAATRAAALRMLARVPGVTVTEQATDPSRRAATEVRFVDGKHRPGVVNAIYLDPATTQLLAIRRTLDGKPDYTRLCTERHLVNALPEEVVRVLGNERTAKEIDG